MNKQWWKKAVVYQIYPRSFKDSNGDGVGDLQGIISKLDYLKDLGIDVIWVCPIYQSPNDDNGYDISNYKDIMDEFGSMDDFEQLLKEVHDKDMKLIMDLVVNHTSDEHPWFIESRQTKDNPYRDYYIWKDGKNGAEPNNWESIFGGSAWEYDETTEQYYLHVFSKKQPDLNWENPRVRDDVYEMINWWLEKGIDGFRVDAISHIKKQPGLPDLPNPEGKKFVPSFDGHMNHPGIDDYLNELKERTFKHYDILTVGEANGVNLEDADRWVGEENGYFNMIFQFEHMGLWDKTPSNKTNFDVIQFKEILTKWQKGLDGIGWNALYLENHDQVRSVSRFGNASNYHNESAKALAACYFLMHGTPYIYQGQEIGMTNVKFNSIEDYNDVGMINFYKEGLKEGKPHEELMEVIWNKGRDNSRTPMQWDDTQHAGFTSGNPWMAVNPNYKEINVEQQIHDKDSILHFYKQLIDLRKKNDIFVYGRYEVVAEEHEQVYAYLREYKEKNALVIANLSSETSSLTLDGNVINRQAKLLLTNYDIPKEPFTGSVQLKPFETRVYLL